MAQHRPMTENEEQMIGAALDRLMQDPYISQVGVHFTKDGPHAGVQVTYRLRGKTLYDVFDAGTVAEALTLAAASREGAER